MVVRPEHSSPTNSVTAPTGMPPCNAPSSSSRPERFRSGPNRTYGVRAFGTRVARLSSTSRRRVAAVWREAGIFALSSPLGPVPCQGFQLLTCGKGLHGRRVERQKLIMRLRITLHFARHHNSCGGRESGLDRRVVLRYLCATDGSHHRHRPARVNVSDGVLSGPTARTEAAGLHPSPGLAERLGIGAAIVTLPEGDALSTAVLQHVPYVAKPFQKVFETLGARMTRHLFSARP